MTVAIEQYLEDKELLERARAALLKHPLVARNRLGARIRRGVVTVLGRVDTLEQERVAVEAAEQVKGVRQVVSAIKVGQIEPGKEPVGIADDATMRSEVNAAVADAGVTILENQSYVRDGMAHLRGLVPDRRAIWLALAAARRVPGLQGRPQRTRHPGQSAES